MAAVQRTVLIGADPLNLRRLRDHLTARTELAIVAEAATADDALIYLKTQQPDLLFLQPDRFPNVGLDLAHNIRSRHPCVKLLLVTNRTEIGLVRAYADLGVAAYVLEASLDDLSEYLAAVDADRIVLDRHIASDLRQLLGTSLIQSALAAELIRRADRPPRGDVSQPSTGAPRRKKVLQLAGQGYTNKEIARILGIGESTVAEHLKRYRAKAGSIRRADLGRLLAEGNLG